MRGSFLMYGAICMARSTLLCPEALAAHLNPMCLKTHLKPEDIADPCLFLASQASAAMTGQTLVIDGGVVVTG